MYEVLHVGVGGDPTRCRLRQLPWNARDAGSGKELTYELGNGEGSSTAWMSADERFVLVALVALGKCKDYGREEPNMKGKTMPREPQGYHRSAGRSRTCR